MENIGYPDTKNKKKVSPLNSILDSMIPETYHTSYGGSSKWDLGDEGSGAGNATEIAGGGGGGGAEKEIASIIGGI